MDKALYLDRSTLFCFDRLLCLRNDYAHHECMVCHDICPAQAFVFKEGKLRLDILACTNCGACIGGCPSDALSLLNFEIEHVVSLTQKAKEPLLTCKDTLPCLGAFGVDDWITLCLEAQKTISCNLSHCSTCPINQVGKIEALIEQRIEEANRFIAFFSKYRILLINANKQHKEPTWRSFLTRLTHEKPMLSQENKHPLDSLRKALKPYLQTLKETSLENTFSFIHQKNIDQRCTNCKECVQFCPTGALSYNSDTTQILFQMGKCIGCGICEDICKPKAFFHQQKPFDVVDFAYNKATLLIEHELQVCLTCKCAFSYKGGDKICERCASFEKEHTDMFAFAYEQEKDFVSK